MKRMFLLIFLVVMGFSVDSCKKDDGTTIEFTALQISSAELPESFVLNGTYEIKVTYSIPDGCTNFEGFEVEPKDTTVRDVVAIGWRPLEQQCTLAITTREESFLFNVVHDQTYLFRFWQGEDTNGDPMYLEIEVPVN